MTPLSANRDQNTTIKTMRFSDSGCIIKHFKSKTQSATCMFQLYGSTDPGLQLLQILK